MSKWQPIETAEEMKKPINGGDWRGCPKVLLWVNGEFFTGRWEHDLHATKKRPHWDMDTLRGKRWVRDNQPTHWMKIEPPQAEGQLEEPPIGGDEVSAEHQSAGLTLHEKATP